MKNKNKVIHPISPVFDKESKTLILGSFPSVKSRETMFFYSHPQNRFWRVIAAVFEDEVPESIEEKKAFLYKHKIALWDVIKECEISGSSDASIENVRINDLSKILDNADIVKIYVNGKTAEKMYLKYARDRFKREVIVLPSTSPANAAKRIDDLIEAWMPIKDFE